MISSLKGFLAWMEPHVLQLVARKVYNEMDDVKCALNDTIDTIYLVACQASPPSDGWVSYRRLE